MKLKFAISSSDIEWTDDLDKLVGWIDARHSSRILVAYDGNIIDYDLMIRTTKWAWDFFYAGSHTNTGVKLKYDMSLVKAKLKRELEEVVRFAINKAYFKTLFPKKVKSEIECLAREH